ncbi:RNA polymerase sigma factor [Luteimonas terrae]|uniref:RNA polymerase sigma factor (Sigma-70 family) n=1 Tax=Luteimonas terrae TaxID=1530191 RepID=A0ABU1Y1G8_9GAMM|nr:RNA polymerase sigma factor [Luteimonas terrae]MDR7194867.1 RNA polymerase sigma factor (sigma-70 family) [Luteimonas terrae]
MSNNKDVVSSEVARRRAAFDAALTHLQPDLLHFMQRRIRNVDTAADLTQEALLRMLVYREAPDIACHASLMYRIAWNLLREHWRTQRGHHASSHVPLDLTEPLLADAVSVEDIVDARRALHRLSSQALEALPPKCRKAFALHRADGLTYPEIAAEMGVSVKTVEKHISRALAVCRAAVDPAM